MALTTMNQPMRVLLVEDSEDDALLLRSELARATSKLTIRRVDNAEGMRKALTEAEWDIVISDHSLPQFSSLQALQVINEAARDIPFIIYSGVVSEHVAVAAMYNGAQDAIPKGNFPRLLAAIERELQGAAVRRDKHRADLEVHRLAFYDGLTGLPNRNLFCSFVERQIALGGVARASVHIVDVDRFLRINSCFGHKVGDQLLRQIAQRLQDCVPEGGMVARLGSNEFGIFVTTDFDNGQDSEGVEFLRRAFVKPFSEGTLEFCLSACIGVAIYSRDGRSVPELLTNAETAMFRAKELGGNTHQFYAREMGVLASEDLRLESALRKAVERDELMLEYQPHLEVETGRLTGVEALVRWRHPELGLLQPDSFIPLANESGLITGIGEWVLNEACRQAKAWHRAGHSGLTVAVNVSAVQFWQPGLVRSVRDALLASGLAPECLELEITESVLMRDVESTIGTLEALKAMKVRISVDDFGAGYSSLNYLRRFPVDILKVDKSFSNDVIHDKDAAAIVRAVGELGHSLGLVTVAEGVETADQLNFFHGQHYDRVQGFLFSRPRAAEDIDEMLNAGFNGARRMAPRTRSAPALVGQTATWEMAQRPA